MLLFKVSPAASVLGHFARVALLPALVAPCFFPVSPARADDPLVGVPGRTTGSQTFIRVRPSALTPPVAKVPASTKLYVWGKFGDWYRVETHDHAFGWVYKSYIRSSRLWKVKTISQFKAEQASDKGSSQTLYGTEGELKTYHARYGGAGAIKGLALKGIYLPGKKTSPVKQVKANKKAPTAPVLIARAPAAPRVPLQAPVRPASSWGTKIPPPTPEELGLNARPTSADPLRKAPDILAPGASSLANRVRSWTPSPPTTSVQNPTRVMAPPVVQKPAVQAPVVQIRVVQAPMAASNGNGRTLAPVLPSAGALGAPRAPFIKPVAAPKKAAPQDKHAQAWLARKRAKEQKWKWLQAKKVNDWKWRQAQAQKKREDAQNRREWLAKQRQNRYANLSSRKEWQRKTLAQKNGLTPKQLPSNIPGGTIKPYSADELMRARDQFLRGNTSLSNGNTALSSGAVISPQPSGLNSPAAPTDLKGNLNVLLFGSAQQKNQTAQELSASSASTEQGQNAPDALSAPTSPSMPIPYAVPAAPASSVQAPAPSRGGSPRDRAAANWNNGMATQALSYRGMPYRFGAASPSRGFDCSGLIYFLLRQRGLNPPRTAAGYRTYGQAVERGQLQTGDLILFANTYKRGISHIGVYLKDGKFIHAASTRQGVRVDSLSKGYFASKYWGARRVK